ncbi:MAG: hypothetical protein ACYTEQ_19190 [Planctomycetota bacterium]|jgi:hypothetical protein
MTFATKQAQAMRDYLDGKTSLRPVATKEAEPAPTAHKPLSQVFEEALSPTKTKDLPAKDESAYDSLASTIKALAGGAP